MPTQEELNRLAEDLKYIKTAIQKSGSLMRWVTWKVPIRWVALVGGLMIIAIAFLVSQLQMRYGDFAAVPDWIKAVFFGSIALLVMVFALWKLRVIMRQLKKTGNEVTHWALCGHLYPAHGGVSCSVSGHRGGDDCIPFGAWPGRLHRAGTGGTDGAGLRILRHAVPVPGDIREQFLADRDGFYLPVPGRCHRSHGGVGIDLRG